MPLVVAIRPRLSSGAAVTSKSAATREVLGQARLMPHKETLLYGTDVWPALRAAALRRGPHHVAVGYAGQDAAEMLPLNEADVVVVDASDVALRGGVTHPEAIAAWLARGVRVFSHDGLHAKAYVLGSCVFIGSANVSRNSESRLVEAMLHTDAPAIRRQVKDMVLALADKAREPLDEEWLTAARAKYRPQRHEPGTERPGQEQVLPVGNFRLQLSKWDSDAFEFDDPNQEADLAAVSRRGVEIQQLVVDKSDTYRINDVLVLLEENDQQGPVQLWPPMRVLRVSQEHSAGRTVYLRGSRLLAPMPSQVLAEMRPRIPFHRWLQKPAQERLLSIWGLDRATR